jgi:hypothetical protein
VILKTPLLSEAQRAEKKGSMKEFSTSFEKIREYSLLKGLASLFAQSF